MLRSALLILALTGLHARPLPLRRVAVPVELRRQGTQPSRPQLVDLQTGLQQDHVSEMDRRVSHGYYVPFAVDQFRQGTQNSRVVLVDLRTGLPKEQMGEMQRIMGNEYVPPSLDEFRQGTQNSQVVLVDPRTGLMREPIGEMARSSVRTVPSIEQTCLGSVINGRCYQFVPDAKTFSDAESSCGQLAPGGHLASVSSAELHSRLAAMVTEASKGPVLTWLGAVLRFDKFQWLDGSSWDYSDLMPGRLLAGDHSESCLEMFRVDERWWSTADCNLQRPFICSYPLTAGGR